MPELTLTIKEFDAGSARKGLESLTGHGADIKHNDPHWCTKHDFGEYRSCQIALYYPRMPTDLCQITLTGKSKAVEEIIRQLKEIYGQMSGAIEWKSALELKNDLPK